MLREYETVYLCTAVIIIWVMIGGSIWYETAVRDNDSVWQTIFAIGQWTGIAVATTLVAIATFEVARTVLARIYTKRIRERALEEGIERGREEERKARDTAWEAWLKRMEEAAAKGEEFDEPPPSRTTPDP